MSLKFCEAGEFQVPTRGEPGKLIIDFQEEVEISIPFIKEVYPVSNKIIPIGNIMFYLENDSSIIIGRVDGSLTKYNKDWTVIGFSSFDPMVIRDKFQFAKNGRLVRNVNDSDQMELYTCYTIMYNNTIGFAVYDIPNVFYIKYEDNRMYLDSYNPKTWYITKFWSKNKDTEFTYTIDKEVYYNLTYYASANLAESFLICRRKL